LDPDPSVKIILDAGRSGTLLGMYLDIDGIAHLPIPVVLWNSTNWGLPGLLVKPHDHAVNASEDPDIDRLSGLVIEPGIPQSMSLQYTNL